MSEHNRRGFLKFAGAGVALAGASTVLPGVASADAAPASSDTAKLPASAGAPLVAYVTDVHSGKVAVMVEGHEVTVTDHQLVARLAHAMHAARSTTL